MIRLLIVDDAVAIQQLVTDALSSDPALEVIGTAPTGGIALAKISQLHPDLVILDIAMPGMDGLETLSAIRKTHPYLPVIMFSALTELGAAATIDALTRGANDYVTKPTRVGSAVVAMQHIREEFIPKIKGLCEPTENLEGSPLRPASIPRPMPVRQQVAGSARARQRVDIVAIGVSTGGPNALMELVPSLPANFPVPVVIVQHMPRLFTGVFAERLASQSAIQVCEGQAGMRLEPAHAWLAPGDSHMVLERDHNAVRLQLHQGPPENACRPAANVLFQSVAAIFGPATLAVVLTGMGQDGLRGCEAIHAAGGQILVQDEATSVVWGMPGCVAKAGLAEQILPLNQVGDAIMEKVSVGRNLSARVRASLQIANR